MNHKLQAPIPSQSAVIRKALLSQIQTAASTAGCIVIQAPAGHGKTTLLSQLLHASKDEGIATAWITLDESDNDIHRLLSHLDELLGSLEESTDVETFAENNDANGHSTWADLFLARLSAIGSRVHFYFDEFHTIDEADVEAFFSELTRKLPESATIFIASRKIPNIGITELQLRECVSLYRYDELKFSLDETREFFRQKETIVLDGTELSIIHRRSEGWPAALQLFRLSLEKDGDKTSLDSLESYTPFQITEYLTSNVLQSQPDDIQLFILKLSYLRKLTASLCDHLLDRNDSIEILRKLEREGLFLNAIDTEHNWFQFHGLFSRYLQRLADRRFPKLEKTINNEAAQWFFDHEHYEECLFHAITAEEFSLAVKAMDLWASTQIANACLLSVERMAQRIPLEFIEKNPTLAVKVTWALTFLRNRKSLPLYLDILKRIEHTSLEQQLGIELKITKAVVELSLDNLPSAFEIVEEIDTGDHTAADFWAFELGAAANIQAFREIACGRFTDARYYLAVGRNHSQHANAAFPAGYNTGLTIVKSYLQGRVSESAELAMAVIHDEELATKDSYAAASAVCCAFFPLYEKNDTETVIKAFERHRHDIDTGLLLDFVAAGYLPLIRIYDGLGDIQKANTLLEDLENIAIGANWPRLVSLCLWERVRRALLQGNFSEALYLSRNAPKLQDSDYLPFINAIEDPVLSQLRLNVHTITAEGGLDIDKQLATHIDHARFNNLIAREVKLRVFRSILKHSLDDKRAAQKELKVTLSLAQDYGFHRTITDEGPIILQLLQEANLTEWPAQIRRLATDLIASSTPSQDPPSTRTATLLEPLTKREMQMLTLLAKGDSNKAIARQLFVSENTVKFHLKNIYHKLGVTTRTQAINSALSLNLL